MSEVSNKTVLGTGCRLNGELTLDSDAVIMGDFKGTLRVSGGLEIAESARVSGGIIAGSARLSGQVDAQLLRVSGILEIMPNAKVTGTIIAGTLRLAGTVEADVVAEHGVELLAGAQLTGQLYTTTLSVVEGAVFQGDVCVGPKAIQAAGALLRQAQENADGNGQAEAPAAEAQPQAWNENQEQAEADTDDNGQPAVTVSQSLNSILQRRRAKVLSTSGVKPVAPINNNGTPRNQ